MKSIFWVLAIISRIIMVLFVLTSEVGLMPDEAQYWTWSQYLDIGYYSKPPGIAWQIAAGTSLLGSTELGVRLLAIILPVFSALVIRAIVQLLTLQPNVAWLSAIAFIISPIGLSGSLFATTDSMMVLMWLLATYAYLQNPRQYCTIGLFIGIGALWKWWTYMLWIPILIDGIHRKENPFRMVGGSVISLIGLIPSAVWNWSHGFVTFKHVESTILHDHDRGPTPNPFSFFFAGVALLSPGFFLLALPGLFWRRQKGFFSEQLQKINFVRITIWLIWGGLFLGSFTRKMQGNWALIAQVLCFVLLGVVIASHTRLKKWPYVVSCLLAVFMQGLLLLPPYTGGALLRISPLKPGLGCDKISQTLGLAGYNAKEDFLFSNRYQTACQLWFYGPGQNKTYFLNFSGLRQNQFTYWPGMREECLGKTGYFISLLTPKDANNIEEQTRQLQKSLEPYFTKVDPAQTFWLTGRNQTSVRLMIVIRAINYNGKTPHPLNKF